MKEQCVCGMVTVGTKGQIVIPKKARDYFGFETGDDLIVLADPKLGIIIVKADTVQDLKLKLNQFEEMER